MKALVKGAVALLLMLAMLIPSCIVFCLSQIFERWVELFDEAYARVQRWAMED